MEKNKMTKKFELPKLNYEYDALEPYLDAQTIKIHHGKHHQGYTNNFNKALEGHPEYFDMTAEEIIANIEDVPEDIRTAVRNNGGGYINHNLFWTILKKDVKISDGFLEVINTDFKSFEDFKKELSNAAATQFGSGWAWLVTDGSGNLSIISTSNQDSPLSDDLIPLLCIDVWEHSYYLKYQNKRPEYIEEFFNIINWEEVERRYKEAIE